MLNLVDCYLVCQSNGSKPLLLEYNLNSNNIDLLALATVILPGLHSWLHMSVHIRWKSFRNWTQSLHWGWPLCWATASMRSIINPVAAKLLPVSSKTDGPSHILQALLNQCHDLEYTLNMRIVPITIQVTINFHANSSAPWTTTLYFRQTDQKGVRRSSTAVTHRNSRVRYVGLWRQCDNTHEIEIDRWHPNFWILWRNSPVRSRNEEKFHVSHSNEHNNNRDTLRFGLVCRPPKQKNLARSQFLIFSQPPTLHSLHPSITLEYYVTWTWKKN